MFIWFRGYFAIGDMSAHQWCVRLYFAIWGYVGTPVMCNRINNVVEIDKILDLNVSHRINIVVEIDKLLETQN